MTPPPPPPCPYRVLGVPRGASADDIKRAFVEAAKGSHPDRLPPSSSAAERAAAASRFALVADAYAVLGDASRRAAFDGGGGGGGGVGSSYAYASASGYYRPRGSAYNPYGGGFRASSSQNQQQQQRWRQQQRPPSFLSNLFRLVAARSTRWDAWSHVALAVAALGGAAAAATAGDSLWREHNRGKLFEDVVASAAASAGQRQHRQQQQQQQQRQRQENSVSGSSMTPRTATAAAAGIEEAKTATTATDEP